MVGALSRRTHTLYAGFGLARVFMLVATVLVLLIPKSIARKLVPKGQVAAEVTWTHQAFATMRLSSPEAALLS